MWGWSKLLQWLSLGLPSRPSGLVLARLAPPSSFHLMDQLLFNCSENGSELEAGILWALVLKMPLQSSPELSAVSRGSLYVALRALVGWSRLVTLSRVTGFADILHSAVWVLGCWSSLLSPLSGSGAGFAGFVPGITSIEKGLRRYVHILLYKVFCECCFHLNLSHTALCGCLMSHWLGIWEPITRGESLADVRANKTKGLESGAGCRQYGPGRALSRSLGDGSRRSTGRG